GLSITLHTRRRPDLAGAAAELADALAAPGGLRVGQAKQSIELHPPIDADKGTALLALAEGAQAVLYAGDDNGDVPAYEALGVLAARTPPVTTLGVIVDGPELPAKVRAQRGLLLEDQRAILDLLDALAV
ncbi:MAG: trehalose-phosphatase, partial [Ilumatobacteraceae bacterium]|nr:trehalose-phosphatase [Ilumatobacteraceae bacterium]